ALAARHGGAADEDAVLSAIAPLDAARDGELAPVTGRRHLAGALASPAWLLVDVSLASLVPRGRRWVHPYASYALAGLLEEIAPLVTAVQEGAISPRARLGEGVVVGPGAVVLGDADVGAGSVIEPNAVIYGRV